MQRLELWSRSLSLPSFLLFCFSSLALVLGGCQRAPLACRTEYLYPEYLASAQVETPDPCLRCYYGQQLVVHWKLPRNSLGPYELLVDLRFGTRELEQVCIPLTQSSGYWVYKLINSDYWCKGGILSYRVRLFSDEGYCLDEWKHHLWAEVVLIENACY